MKTSQEMIDRYSKMALENGGTVKPHVVAPPMVAVSTFEGGGEPKSSFVKHSPLHWGVTWYGIVPGKPRMTQKDKWAKHPAVMRYRAFADALRAACGLQGKMLHCPKILNWTIYLPMPKSWSKKVKLNNLGMPHQTKPDRDNLDKAILDALFEDDSAIYMGILEKRWEDERGPRLELEVKF